MIYWIGGGIVLLVYIVASYIWMAKDLEKNAGPGGLGWLAWPLAPLMPPMILLGMLKRTIHNWTR